jgi:hypothetical protein
MFWIHESIKAICIALGSPKRAEEGAVPALTSSAFQAASARLGGAAGLILAVAGEEYQPATVVLYIELRLLGRLGGELRRSYLAEYAI